MVFNQNWDLTFESIKARFVTSCQYCFGFTLNNFTIFSVTDYGNIVEKFFVKMQSVNFFFVKLPLCAVSSLCTCWTVGLLNRLNHQDVHRNFEPLFDMSDIYYKKYDSLVSKYRTLTLPTGLFCAIILSYYMVHCFVYT